MTLKVALAHDYLIKNGGAEKVLEAFHELFPDAPVYTLVYNEQTTGGHFKDWDIRTSYLQNRMFINNAFDYWRFAMPLAVESFDLSEYDLVISDASSFIKGVLTQPRCLHLCYIHTPTRFLWFDIQDHINRGRFLKASRWVVPAALHFIREWDWLAAQRPDYLISNSHNTQERVEKFYRRESEVIYPPVETERFNKQPRHPSDFFLIVSRLEAHKKIDIAIKACNQIKAPLHIVGIGKQEKHLHQIAGPTIKFLGQLNDTQVADELSRARAFIAPQTEDFGIAMVEALAAGCPVIAKNLGGAREIVDQTSGVLIDQMTPENLAQQIERFSNHNFSASACRQKAGHFSKRNFLAIMQKQIDTLMDKQ